MFAQKKQGLIPGPNGRSGKRGLKAAILKYSSWIFGGQALILFCGLGLTLAILGLYRLDPLWLRFQEYKVYDLMLERAHSKQTSGVPVIVDIDEKSLAQIGQWPWPRYRIALLLAELQRDGALAVGLDTLFAEPDRTSPLLLGQEIRKELEPDFNFIGLPKELEDFDKVLAEILKRGPFALGYYLDVLGDTEGFGSATLRRDCEFKPFNLGGKDSPDAMPREQAVFAAKTAICPMPVLLTSAPQAGFFNTVPDSDNILRRIPLFISYKGRLCPSLALATAWLGLKVTGAGPEMTSLGFKSLTLDSARLGKRTIPLDEHGQMLLNYRGPGKSFKYVSAADVLKNETPAGTFKDKIVFVGTSAAALKDTRATPFDRVMPGVEVHATLVDTIIQGDFLLRPDLAIFYELLGIVGAGVLSAALLSFTSARWLLVPFLALCFGFWEGSVYAMSSLNIYVSPLCPMLALALNFVALTFLKFWREERKRRFIHGAFSQYVSPKVVEQIVSSPEKLSLAGEEKQVSILFSDVRGFTTISERLSPSQVVDLLHEYFTPMTRIITQNSGTLDKFIGDAIMAFWNAPLDVADFQKMALQSALAMQNELVSLNAGFTEKYGFNIDIGIGLHSGSVRVGNFGSHELFDYTIIGDSVNLCSRLEGLTKYYGVKILVSQDIKENCGEGFRYLEVDRVKVKGKKKPVTIYNPMSLTQAEKLGPELEIWEEFFKLYQGREFSRAKALLESRGKLKRKIMQRIYLKRCQVFTDTPPTENWEGVFTHETK